MFNSISSDRYTAESDLLLMFIPSASIAQNPLLYAVLVALFFKFFCLGVVKLNFTLRNYFV